MNRQEDLMKVFDRTWKANHNDVAKRGREREKKFIDKMFGNNYNTNSSVNNPKSRVEHLNQDIAGASNFQRQNQINNIIKKWK